MDNTSTNVVTTTKIVEHASPESVNACYKVQEEAIAEVEVIAE